MRKRDGRQRKHSEVRVYYCRAPQDGKAKERLTSRRDVLGELAAHGRPSEPLSHPTASTMKSVDETDTVLSGGELGRCAANRLDLSPLVLELLF